MSDEWMPVRGGPRDGCEYLPSSEAKPGTKVNLNECSRYHVTGKYYVSECGRFVEWRPYPTRPPVFVRRLPPVRHLARRERPARGAPADVGGGGE